MSSDAALKELARMAGIFPRYTDMAGCVRDTTVETARALVRACGFAVENAQDIKDGLRLVRSEQADRLFPADIIAVAGAPQRVPVSKPANWRITEEFTGKELAQGRAETEITLPDLPLGVHELYVDAAGGEQWSNLLVVPPRLPSLREVTGQTQVWGCMAPLYALRSSHESTLGNFEDLGNLAQLLGNHGAAFAGINPVHALGAAALETISPYSPTHRGFLNTDHLAVPLHAQTSDGPLIDYGLHRRVQRAALKAAFGFEMDDLVPRARDDFEAYCAEEGSALHDFARYEYFSEEHGPDWRLWPAALQRADAAPQVPDKDLRFTKWMQWQASQQLGAAQAKARAAGMALGLYLDLAVGARVGGAESWGANNAAAPGVTLGAPPDHLSPAGQNWQLAAQAPRKLQATGYAAFRHVLRASMRHCGLLRIDHALGLNRSFWIPEDGSPGGYVRQNMEALIAVISIEAARAQTVVVGEDLGLVPQGFRETMAQAGFYGYSVLQFEKDKRGRFLPPASLRPQSLACFATHDTPTLAGFWEGRDIAWWEKLGWIKPQEASRAMTKRGVEKRQLVGLPAPRPLPKTSTQGVRDTIHAALASAPAELVAVQLEDVLLQKETQNLPGTVDEHPNWRRPLPLTLEEISASPAFEKTARIMTRSGRAEQMRKDIP